MELKEPFSTQRVICSLFVFCQKVFLKVGVKPPETVTTFLSTLLEQIGVSLVDMANGVVDTNLPPCVTDDKGDATIRLDALPHVPINGEVTNGLGGATDEPEALRIFAHLDVEAKEEGQGKTHFRCEDTRTGNVPRTSEQGSVATPFLEAWQQGTKKVSVFVSSTIASGGFRSFHFQFPFPHSRLMKTIQKHWSYANVPILVHAAAHGKVVKGQQR